MIPRWAVLVLHSGRAEWLPPGAERPEALDLVLRAERGRDGNVVCLPPTSTNSDVESCVFPCPPQDFTTWNDEGLLKLFYGESLRPLVGRPDPGEGDVLLVCPFCVPVRLARAVAAALHGLGWRVRARVEPAVLRALGGGVFDAAGGGDGVILAEEKGSGLDLTALELSGRLESSSVTVAGYARISGLSGTWSTAGKRLRNVVKTFPKYPIVAAGETVKQALEQLLPDNDIHLYGSSWEEAVARGRLMVDGPSRLRAPGVFLTWGLGDPSSLGRVEDFGATFRGAVVLRVPDKPAETVLGLGLDVGWIGNRGSSRHLGTLQLREDRGDFEPVRGFLEIRVERFAREGWRLTARAIHGDRVHPARVIELALDGAGGVP